jgi:outer membrane biosynthesis protein TonB
VVTDQAVAVIRRHGLGIAEDSAWAVLGRLGLAAARLTGVILLYSLRFILAPAETAQGLRRMVLNAAPLPGATQDHPAPDTLPETAPVPGAAPEVLPEPAPEMISRPILEAVPAIPERPQVTPGKQPGPATPERLAEFYATDLAEGRVPSKRQIKRDWPVGYGAASDLHDHLTAAMAAT